MGVNEEFLTVKCIQFGSCNLIGQFSRDVTGYKTQVA